MKHFDFSIRSANVSKSLSVVSSQSHVLLKASSLSKSTGLPLWHWTTVLEQSLLPLVISRFCCYQINAIVQTICNGITPFFTSVITHSQQTIFNSYTFHFNHIRFIRMMLVQMADLPHIKQFCCQSNSVELDCKDFDSILYSAPPPGTCVTSVSTFFCLCIFCGSQCELKQLVKQMSNN